MRSVNELLSSDRYEHQAYVFSSFQAPEPDAKETEAARGKIGSIDFDKSLICSVLAWRRKSFLVRADLAHAENSLPI